MIINILVFENSSTIRENIALLLANDPELSLRGMFGTIQNCVREAQTARPDVILMDITMPGINGTDAIRALKQALPYVQVIVQTIADDNAHIHDAIRAGASGYLLKPELDACLISAIKELIAGGSPMSPVIAHKVWNIMQRTPVEDQRQICEYGLSKREKEILNCIVHGLSYKMIALKLFIAYETVRSHMKSIYVKLQVDSLTAVVAKAIYEQVV
jgi:DNA-binding NarL/FixJ family response regulator